jgi:NAD-dependent SIR2 family protein deacetylase
MNIAPADLRARYSEGRLVPFIGAGISMAVNWERNGQTRRGLSWRELVSHAAELLGFKDPELLRVRGNDLQILEYFRLKRGEFADLRNWYYAEYSAPNESLELSTIHQALSRLDRCTLYYTTNYDDFLERSFGLLGRTPTVVAIEQHIADSLQRRSRGQHSDCEIV